MNKQFSSDVFVFNEIQQQKSHDKNNNNNGTISLHVNSFQ